MNFDHYLHQAHSQNSIAIDPSWQQGRTIFGGLTAAMVLSYLQAQCQSDIPLRSLAINFCGVTQADQAISFQHQTLSRGKSITQLNGQMLQNGQVVTQVTACYGKARESDVLIEPELATLPAPESGQTMPFIEGLTPNFIQHVHLELQEGQFPFTNSQQHTMGGWMRFVDAEGAMSNLHLIGLLDAWPPVVLQNLKRPAPASSVTWQVDFVKPLTELNHTPNACDWVYFQDHAIRAHNGYANTEAKAFSQSGELLALSRQMVSMYG